MISNCNDSHQSETFNRPPVSYNNSPWFLVRGNHSNFHEIILSRDVKMTLQAGWVYIGGV